VACVDGRVSVIELRWVEEKDGPANFAKGGGMVRKVLQYRYQLPAHPGFVMTHDPITGLPKDAVQWSEWITVPEVCE